MVIRRVKTQDTIKQGRSHKTLKEKRRKRSNVVESTKGETIYSSGTRFEEILETQKKETGGTITKDILHKVDKKIRQSFGNWLADKLIAEGKHEVAKDILIELGEYEKAIPVIISLAVYQRMQGNLSKAKELYTQIAELYQRLGDLDKAKEIKQLIKQL